MTIPKQCLWTFLTVCLEHTCFVSYCSLSAAVTTTGRPARVSPVQWRYVESLCADCHSSVRKCETLGGKSYAHLCDVWLSVKWLSRKLRDVCMYVYEMACTKVTWCMSEMVFAKITWCMYFCELACTKVTWCMSEMAFAKVTWCMPVSETSRSHVMYAWQWDFSRKSRDVCMSLRLSSRKSRDACLSVRLFTKVTWCMPVSETSRKSRDVCLSVRLFAKVTWCMPTVRHFTKVTCCMSVSETFRESHVMHAWQWDFTKVTWCMSVRLSSRKSRDAFLTMRLFAKVTWCVPVSETLRESHVMRAWQTFRESHVMYVSETVFTKVTWCMPVSETLHESHVMHACQWDYFHESHGCSVRPPVHHLTTTNDILSAATGHRQTDAGLTAFCTQQSVLQPAHRTVLSCRTAQNSARCAQESCELCRCSTAFDPTVQKSFPRGRISVIASPDQSLRSTCAFDRKFTSAVSLSVPLLYCCPSVRPYCFHSRMERHGA